MGRRGFRIDSLFVFEASPKQIGELGERATFGIDGLFLMTEPFTLFTNRHNRIAAD
jgi:hypothetical protein